LDEKILKQSGKGIAPDLLVSGKGVTHFLRRLNQYPCLKGTVPSASSVPKNVLSFSFELHNNPDNPATPFELFPDGQAIPFTFPVYFNRLQGGGMIKPPYL
jgi:hypothetical protein